MIAFDPKHLHAVVLVLCGVVLAGEMLVLIQSWRSDQAASAGEVHCRKEWERLLTRQPPPTLAAAQAIEQALAQAQATVAMMRTQLGSGGDDPPSRFQSGVPATRTDAFIDLVHFTERMRVLAHEHEVEVAPSANRFGFAAYGREAPETERIVDVVRQRDAVEHLLRALFAARPLSLLRVEREPALTREQREARTSREPVGPAPGMSAARSLGADRKEAADYFTLDPSRSVRRQAEIDTLALRLVFTGETAVLRAFLNRLAGGDRPILVRDVQVDVAPAQEGLETSRTEVASGGSGSAQRLPASVVLARPAGSMVLADVATAPSNAPRSSPVRTAQPIGARRLSRFTVTVEVPELLTPDAVSAAPVPGMP